MNNYNFQYMELRSLDIDFFYGILSDHAIQILSDKHPYLAYGCIETNTQEPVGILVAIKNENSWEIISIFVPLPYRRNGIASRLLAEFHADLLRFYPTYIEVKYGLLDSKNMTSLSGLFEYMEYDFDDLTGYNLWEIKRSSFSDHDANVSNSLASFPYIQAFDALPNHLKNDFSLKMQGLGYFKEKTLPKCTFAPLTVVYIRENAVIAGCWTEQLSKTHYRVSAFFSTEKSQKVLLDLFHVLKSRFIEQLQEDDVLIIENHIPAMDSIIKKLSDDRASKSQCILHGIHLI